jgi:hypothetical protein
MRHTASPFCVARLRVALWALLALTNAVNASPGPPPSDERTPDPVVARIYEHFEATAPPFVLPVDASRFAPAVWRRVKDLVAFRLHRPRPDGTTVADAPIYLVRDSDIYFTAAAALRNRSTQHDYVWCLLAAVLAHESAHTRPNTERDALMAEAAQLRRCLAAGHLFAQSGWNPLTYLGKVEAKLRRPREHY